MSALWKFFCYRNSVFTASNWNIAMDVVASATGSFRAILLPVPQGKEPIIRLSKSLRSPRIDLDELGAVRSLAIGVFRSLCKTRVISDIAGRLLRWIVFRSPQGRSNA